MASNPWVRFFSDAGLESKFVQKYAVIFNEHRIQLDMLRDLNKEILYDMGVKTMGDVIAILRHSKEVEEEVNRVKVLGKDGERKQPLVREQPKTGSVPQKIRDIRVRPASAGISNNLAARLGPSASAGSAPPSSGHQVISLKRSLDTDVSGSAVKTRRLVDVPKQPQQQVKYVIKQQPEAKPAPVMSARNRSVFQRLGGSTPTVSLRTNTDAVRTLTSGSVLRGITSGSPSGFVPTSQGKATATVKPTNFLVRRSLHGVTTTSGPKTVIQPTGNLSVRNRLGNNTSVTTNLRFQKMSNGGGAPEAKRAAIQRSAAAGATRVSLKKSIFDRLGPMSL